MGSVAISSSDFRERFSISDRQARNELTDLMKAGCLRRVGSGPATRYVRTEKDVKVNPVLIRYPSGSRVLAGYCRFDPARTLSSGTS